MAAGTGARRMQPSESRVHLPHSSMSCTSVSSHSPFRVSVTVQLMGVTAPRPLPEKSVQFAGYTQIRGNHLFQVIKKAPNQSADAQKINWNLTLPRIYIQFLFEYRIKYRQHVINPIIGFPVIKLCIGINSKRYLGVNERRCHKFCKYDLLFYRIIISVIIIILIRT